MLKVGLTGGYATGKSFVAQELERLGCLVIYADRLGHQVLEPDREAYEPVLSLFGSHLRNTDGTIDRKRLGEIVFKSPELLAKLNAIIHPAVFRLEEESLGHFCGTNPNGIAVIEAAILIETGRYKNFDRLIVTSCDLETQISRGMSRDGLTRDEVLVRLDRQMPLSEKLRFANFVIDTSSDKDTTMRQVQHVFKQLQEVAK